MIRRNDVVLLGKLVKPHGTGGSVLVRFEDLRAEDIRDMGTVFIDIDGLLVPFFVESLREKSTGTAVVKFEGINSPSGIGEFAGNKVYIDRSNIRHKKRAVTGLPDLTGYKIEDHRLGFVGIAGEITGIANNPLLHVQSGDREFLVPVHEDIILEINHQKKLITINAPEGLFDL